MSLKQQADQLLSAAVTDGAVPGVVALATNAEGTYYEGGFGERIQGDGVEMTPDTVVWLASMTKAITGAAVMQLVEQGKLELDAPASRVLPVVLPAVDASCQPWGGFETEIDPQNWLIHAGRRQVHGLAHGLRCS